MSYTEEWFSEESQQYLGGLGRSVKDVPGLILEIGAWEGRATVALANAIAPRDMHSVDTWNGSPGEISADLAAQRDVFATWSDNVATLTKGNVYPHRMDWREYLPTITEPVALAFIDAEHTYAEVRDNVLALLPLLAPGGVLCGDDWHHPPVAKALLETLPEDDVFVFASVWSWRKPR